MVQIGTRLLPIIVTPRIDGKVVTQTEIKAKSTGYVDDNNTPLRFGLEIKQRNEAILTLQWDETKSSNSAIFFQVPDSVYASAAVYTVTCFWTVGTSEKIYALAPYHLTVEDIHDE